MAEYLVVSDAVSPVSDGEDALSVAGLARALVASKHRVTVLSLAAPETVGSGPLSQAELYVLGTPAGNRGQVASVLATAAASLARDGLLKPHVLIAWGD